MRRLTWVFWGALLIIVLYWHFWQLRKPVGYKTLKKYAYMAFLGSICLFFLYTNFIALTIPLLARTNTVGEGLPSIPLAYAISLLVSGLLTFLQVPSIFKQRIKALRQDQIYHRLIPMQDGGSSSSDRIQKRPLLWSTQSHHYLRDFLVFSTLLTFLLYIFAPSIKELHALVGVDKSGRPVNLPLNLLFLVIVASGPLAIGAKWVRSQSRIRLPILSFREFFNLYGWYFLISLTANLLGSILLAILAAYFKFVEAPVFSIFTTLLVFLSIVGAFLIQLAFVNRFLSRQGRLLHFSSLLFLLILTFSIGFSPWARTTITLISAWVILLITAYVVAFGIRSMGERGGWLAILLMGAGTLLLCTINLNALYKLVAPSTADYSQDLLGQLLFCGSVLLLQAIALPFFVWPLFNSIQHWAGQPKKKG